MRSVTHTSRQEFHDEVEVHFVLKTVEHLDHPEAIGLHQDVPLGPDVTDLRGGEGFKDICQVQGLSSAGLPVLFPACQLSEGSSLHRRDQCLFSAPGEPRIKDNQALTRSFRHYDRVSPHREAPGPHGALERHIIVISFEVFTSPKAPRPITFRDSKSSRPSRVRLRRRNSVSFLAC